MRDTFLKDLYALRHYIVLEASSKKGFFAKKYDVDDESWPILRIEAASAASEATARFSLFQASDITNGEEKRDTKTHLTVLCVQHVHFFSGPNALLIRVRLIFMNSYYI